jgi:glycosyltransferase involved in cell wall biosynthesis
MTTFKPTTEALHSIDSILNQTYKNFEFIIVDDGSGAEYQPVLDQIQARDARIRLVRLEQNVGTYGARNAAWLHANGRYITGQDSDDWSHPRRLELQVRNLDKYPGLAGNWCVGLQVSPDLELILESGLSPVKRGQRSVPVSMMITHSPTLLTLGFFDSSRKSADSEFIERIHSVFGREGFHEVPETLYVVQKRGGSLTRNDFQPGWKHINRQIYHTAYSRWRSRRTRTSAESAFVSLGPERRFPAPASFKPESMEKQERSFDLLVMADWYSPSIWHETFLDRIKAALAEGESVAFAQLASCFSVAARPGVVSDQLFSLYESGQIDFVALDDIGVQVGSLLTADEYLIFADPQLSTVAVESVTVLTRKDTLKEIRDFGLDIASRMFPPAEKQLEEVQALWPH